MGLKLALKAVMFFISVLMLLLTAGYFDFSPETYFKTSKSGVKTAQVGARTTGFKAAPGNEPEKSFKDYAREWLMLGPVNMVDSSPKPSGSELQKLSQRAVKDRRKAAQRKEMQELQKSLDY